MEAAGKSAKGESHVCMGVCPCLPPACQHVQASHTCVGITHTVALACVICDLLVYPCPRRHHAGPHG